MSKALSAVVVIIIIVVIIGAVSAFYLLGDLSSSKKKEDEEPEVPNTPPTAFFTGNTSGRVDEMLWFDGNGSSDKDGVITRYKWDFDDGQTLDLSGPNASVVNHTYKAADVYKVNLTVFDDVGAKDWYTEEITILPKDYEASNNDILLSRIGRDTTNTTIPVDQFAFSLLIDISLTWIPSLDGNAKLDATVYDPLGSVIGNQSRDFTGTTSIGFEFYAEDLIYPGDYELEATCTQGSLYLSYDISVEYA
jgi:PKD repeat protein